MDRQMPVMDELTAIQRIPQQRERFAGQFVEREKVRSRGARLSQPRRCPVRAPQRTGCPLVLNKKLCFSAGAAYLTLPLVAISTPMHVLLLHGNGGSRTRFQPLLAQLHQGHPEVQAVIPKLSGFDGRPLPPDRDYWDLFLSEIEQALGDAGAKDWVFYGHGIGGSLLMELAGRGYAFPSGQTVVPRRVILNSVIGASLHKRFFPQLMKPLGVRKTMQQLVAAPLLQPIWEQRLFQHPGRIPYPLRQQFFADYAQCEAFPVFFDLITAEWYRALLPRIDQQPFHFLWGSHERVVQAKYLKLWRNDFPRATFEVIEGWDHFPMLDQPEEFTAKFVKLLTHE